MFGTPEGGEALYNITGCNECHGVNGEGTAPEGKRPAPALAGKEWNYYQVRAVLRMGEDQHAGILPYTEAQLSDTDLNAMLKWLKDPESTNPASTFSVDPDSMITLLAYERDGKPMSGTDGLIQLIVGIDEYAGRYSHWVQSIQAE